MNDCAPDTAWRPTARPERLRLRARLRERIRRFFARRRVLEVDTPVLASAAPTDPHLHALHTRLSGERAPRFLQTSPEFAMKRLLAAGVGDCWQLARVFRDGERGRLHHPEFDLLEWYRIGMDHPGLMSEVEALVHATVADERAVPAAERLAYRDAFVAHAGVDPLAADTAALRAAALRAGVAPAGLEPGDRDGWCDVLLSGVVVPALPRDRLVFIDRWPASQAALARLAADDPRVACRFELYWEGVELANGYHELTDAAEQRRRFAADHERREALGLDPVPADEHLLAALEAGLPDCAGVALGFDRLAMLAAHEHDLAAVVAFPPGRT